MQWQWLRFASCCVVTFLACGGPPPSVDLSALERACKQPSAPSTTLDLRARTNFQWQRLYVFGPYTPMEQIENTLGLAWAPASTSGIAERDDVTLLVFVQAGSVAHWLLHPRDAGDFSAIVAPDGLSPEAARFAIRRLELEVPRCILLPIE